MDICNYYSIKIYEKWSEIKNIYTSNPDNKLISKIFEWYVCVNLTDQYKKIFYEYTDIDPDFREENKMSQTDTGIDCCDLDSTIVQCKLRSNNLNWGELGTFFGSQVIWSNQSKEKIIRWKNLIIARNSNSKLSYNLANKLDLFEDKTFCLDEFIEYCDGLLSNPPIYPKINKSNPVLRDYQVDCIGLIKNVNKNLIINLPTGTGKNFIIVNSLEAKKKYLILVPRIILMEQIETDIIGLHPEFESGIQTIGNGNCKFKSKKSITICVFNSISLINNFDQFDKIFVDEAHHIVKPQIYMDEDNLDVDSDNDLDNLDIDSDNDLDNDEDSDIELDVDSDLDNSDIDSNKNITNKTNESEPIDSTEDEVNDNSTYIDIIRGLTKYNNNVYMSATIDKIEGFDYYCKDIRDMIGQGYLCDYTINIPVFSEDITNLNICYHLIKNYSHIIIYCNSQKEGIEINNILNKLVKGCSEYIDCKTTKTIRDKILRKFKKGKLTFLVNVKILVEGFDAPITQGVCFIHMPKSKTTLVQIIGRALRLHPNKKFANVIL
jgi:superfamily II DNA or RNA helicase